MDNRARSRVGGFLIGAMLIEGAALWFVFRNELTQPAHIEPFLFLPLGNLKAWALACAVTAVYVAYAAMASPLIRAHVLAPKTWGAYTGLRLLAVPAAVIVGVLEEVLFRKVLMDFAAHQGFGFAIQIVVTAVAFGLAHGLWGLLGGKLKASLAPMIATAAIGALLGGVYLIGGRSLAPCIAAHIAMNLFLEPWLAMAAVTNSWGHGAAPSSPAT